MRPTVRLWVFLAAAAGFGGILLWGILLWGMRGLPAFGHYRGPCGYVILAVAPHERRLQNAVTAVNFDYRAFDTLGEEFILFASVAGVTLLLRKEGEDSQELGDASSGAGPQEEQSEDQKEMLRADPSDAVRAFSYVVLVLTFFLGLYMIFTAHISMGGGFQGGVIVATAWVLLYLAGGERLFHRLGQTKVFDVVEAVGAGGFAVVSLGAVLTGAAFLQNVLPLGHTGSVMSSGTILLINAAVGLEVAAGFILLTCAFLKELIRRPE